MIFSLLVLKKSSSPLIIDFESHLFPIMILTWSQTPIAIFDRIYFEMSEIMHGHSMHQSCAIAPTEQIPAAHTSSLALAS